MARMKAVASSKATLIGDVVGSRDAVDRRALHRDVTRALIVVADDSLDAPSFPVGDEFQGSSPTVGLAIAAALSVRLALAPAVDVRFGISVGRRHSSAGAPGAPEAPGRVWP